MTAIGEEDTKTSEDEKTRPFASNTAKVKLRLEPLHTLHTNPFIYSSLHHHHASSFSSSFLSKSVSAGNGSTAVAMTSQNAKALKRKQRLARSILQSSSSSNPNIKGGTHELAAAAETSYLFGNTACCVAWAPNPSTQSLRRKNVHLLAVATPYNALNSMGSAVDPQQQQQQHGEDEHASSSPSITGVNSHTGNSNTHSSLDPSSSVYILVFDESSFHRDANVSLLREIADVLGIPPPSKALAHRPREEMSRNHDPGHVSSNHSDSIEKIGIFRRHIFQHTLQRNKYSEDPLLDQSSSLLSSTSQEGKTFWESLKGHFIQELNHVKEVFLYEVFSDGRILSTFPDHDPVTKDPTSSEDDSIQHSASTLTSLPLHTPDQNPLKPVLVFQLSLPSTGSTIPMEVCSLEWNEDGSALFIVQRRKGGTNFVSVTNPSATNALANANTSLTATTHSKKKKGQHHTFMSSFNQYSLSGHTATSFWHVPDWLYTFYEEELFNKDGGILGLVGLGGDIGSNNPFNGENPLAGMHQDLIVRRSPDGRYADDESDEDDGKSSFPLWDWYLSQYVLKDRDTGTIVGTNISQHSKDSSTVQNILNSTYSRITLRNMVESYASPMEIMAPPPSSSSIGMTGKPGKKSAMKTAVSNSSLANADITCILWEKHTQSLNKQSEKLDSSMGDAHIFDRRDLSAKLKNSRSSTWIALCTAKGQVILHNTAASCVSHFVKRRAQSSSSALIAQAIDISSSLQNRSVDVPCKIKKRITCGIWMDNILVLATTGSGQLTLVHTYSKEVQMPHILNAASEKRHIVSNMIIEDACSERCADVIGDILLPGGRDAIDMVLGTAEYDYGGHTTTVLSVNLEGRALAFYCFPKLPNNSNFNTQGPLNSQAVEISFGLPSSSPNDAADDSFLLSSYRTMSTARNETGVSCGNIMRHFLIPNTSLVLVSFISGYFALVDWENATILSDAEVLSKRYEADSNETGHAWDDDPFLLDVVFHQPSLTFACLTLTGHVVVMRIRVLVGSHGLKPTDCICSSGMSIHRKIHTRQARLTSTSTGSSNTQSPSCRTDPVKDHPVLSTIDTLCSTKIDHVPGKKGWLLSFSPDGECLSVAAGDEAIYTLHLREDDTESKKLASEVLDAIFHGFDRRFYFTAIIVLLYMTWLIKMS